MNNHCRNDVAPLLTQCQTYLSEPIAISPCENTQAQYWPSKGLSIRPSGKPCTAIGSRTEILGIVQLRGRGGLKHRNREDSQQISRKDTSRGTRNTDEARGSSTEYRGQPVQASPWLERLNLNLTIRGLRADATTVLMMLMMFDGDLQGSL